MSDERVRDHRERAHITDMNKNLSPVMKFSAYMFGWTLAAGVQYAATLTGRLTAGLRGKK